jgi:streptogramin lyase
MNFKFARPVGALVAAWMSAGATALAATPFMLASDYQGPMRRVDPSTGTIIGTLSVGFGAGEIDLGPDGLIYASHFESSSIEKINPVTGLDAGTISLPGKPRDVTFGPDGQLYVALTGNGFGGGAIGVYRFNLSTQQLSSQFNTSSLNGSPIGIAFGPGNDLFVCLDARYGGNGTHSVVRIDGQSGNSKGTFALAGVSIPQSLAFASNGEMYVGNQGTGTITHYGPTGSYLGSLVAAAGNTQGLYFLPDGDLVWGQGDSTFSRYHFPSGPVSTFSSGYSFADSVLLVPEPQVAFIPLVMGAAWYALRSRGGSGRSRF